MRIRPRRKKSLIDHVGEWAEQLEPQVQAARDTLTDDLLPAAREHWDDARSTLADATTSRPKRRGRRLLVGLFVALGAAAAAVAVVRRRGQSTTDADPVFPTDPAAPAAPVLDPDEGSADAGASSPDEALADAGEQPHEVTTPDDPLESTDVSAEDDPRP